MVFNLVIQNSITSIGVYVYRSTHQDKEKITSAFNRLADIESDSITMEVSQNTAILCGRMHSI